MKILILSCNTGEGHNSSAKAIKRYMDRLGLESEIKIHSLSRALLSLPEYQRLTTILLEVDCSIIFTMLEIL